MVVLLIGSEFVDLLDGSVAGQRSGRNALIAPLGGERVSLAVRTAADGGANSAEHDVPARPTPTALRNRHVVLNEPGGSRAIGVAASPTSIILPSLSEGKIGNPCRGIAVAEDLLTGPRQPG